MLITYMLLAISTSIDSIGIGITYGLRNIKIKKQATFLLLAIAFFSSMIAILLGKFIHQLLPSNFCNWIGGAFLILMGFILFWQSMKKPESFDKDQSKQIDSKEAFFLGIALSLDSFSIGIGAGVMEGTNLFLFPFFASIFQIAFLMIGSFFGKKITQISHLPSSIWNILAAALLITIGIVSLA